METIDIICNNNGKSQPAEFLQYHEMYMIVVIEGTQITIEMFREDVNKPYIGHTAGLEFIWQQKN